MFRFLFFSILICVLYLSSCRTSHELTTTNEKDSIRIEKIITIDTVWHTTTLDSLTIAYLLQCDNDNAIKDIVIDSLKNKLSAHIEIKDGKLIVTVKNYPDKYYSLYIYERTRTELYRQLIKTNYITKEVKNPLNKWLIITLASLLLILIVIIFKKK